MQAAATVAVVGVGLVNPVFSHQDPFIQQFHARVLERIEKSDNIPNEIKKTLPSIWNELVEKGIYEITALDSEVRGPFVTFQGIIEQELTEQLNENIKASGGVIHTPQPATPLCSRGEISEKLVAPAIEKDPLRLYTVKSRITILRDYLDKGGVLYVVYPKEGIKARTAEQQEIYANELEKYRSKSNLIDCPLNCNSIGNDLIGASYKFTTSENKTYGFSINICQANDPKDMTVRLWFGEYDNSPVKDRIDQVLSTISQSTSESFHRLP